MATACVTMYSTDYGLHNAILNRSIIIITLRDMHHIPFYSKYLWLLLFHRRRDEKLTKNIHLHAEGTVQRDRERLIDIAKRQTEPSIQ